ncbi:response regulator [Pseudomaricurvus alkylphenolicus]|jgi:excisionase family DNA binding protein|uniref:response regulator n=1 Tax=Pseudomaricurvus alkylphenolicus TaxID=1306991 RepID=UPI0014203A53|nr:response regulator [Pseudomaricurvus alkylphenolicus]NIB44271.1 response regulator [Pseudomaricurvus alkylphenolicus]
MSEIRVLTTGEAAKYCGVNFRTVIRWIERGRLKAYKLPGRGDHRIQVEDFVLFLQENDMPVPADLQAPNRSVLVIEDQPEMASAIRRVLARSGFEVEVARDGFSAGTMLSRMKPGLVTLDLKMPGMDGYEVLSFIRSNEEHANTKVLIISAETAAGLERAMALGATDVLPKPFENDELLARVEALIR